MRLWVAGIAAAVLVVGCGTTQARPGSGPDHPGKGGPGGSRAQAMALARHLLDQLVVPPGTRPAHVRSLPASLRDSRAPRAGWVSARRILLAPGKPRAVWETLLPHAPFSESAVFGAVPTSVGTLLPAPAPGVDAADIHVSMAPLSGTMTLVAAYADAAWLPSRTAAEHLEPASIRAVTISADQLAPKPRRLTRTVTSAAVIVRLAAFLNRLRPAPTAALAGVSCPAPPSSFRLQFTATGRQAPAVVVSPAACMADAVTVNGRQQPLLWDTTGGLASMVRKLLGQT
jgi:hypothetical protein